MDYYDELGVTRSAADVDIKKACVPLSHHRRRLFTSLSLLPYPPPTLRQHAHTRATRERDETIFAFDPTNASVVSHPGKEIKKKLCVCELT